MIKRLVILLALLMGGLVFADTAEARIRGRYWGGGPSVGFRYNYGYRPYYRSYYYPRYNYYYGGYYPRTYGGWWGGYGYYRPYSYGYWW